MDKLWKLTHKLALRRWPYQKYYEQSLAPVERAHAHSPKCDYLNYRQDSETGYIYRMPDYPIDVIRTQESLEGLWAGEGSVKGFEKPKRLIPRIARIWCPKLERHIFKSEILNMHIDAVVTPRTLELIDQNKGFDFYILNKRVQDLESNLGSSLKHRMLSNSPDEIKESNKVQKAVQEKGRLLRIKDTIVHEIQHYYHGFRLLFIDLRVSSRYLRKILNGEQLTRREHQQLVRSVADLFRLVPFSIFIIVPFMELLLPVFIKLFPGMLPSTFQTSKDKDAKIKHQLDIKLEMAKFLQQTLDDRALKAKDGDTHSEAAKKFAMFFKEVRESGTGATNEDILRYSKLFEDEVTLDSMTRQQLVACCRLLELQPLGTNAFLRFQLRARLNALKADDELIRSEGIDNLTLSELQAACRARGMRALGVPTERLRAQLLQWLELSLDEHVPPSLLLLSRALYLPENIPPMEQLKATIQSLPEIAATEVRYNIGETEGKVDNRTKLELIEREEAEIKREELQEAVESFRTNYNEEIIDLAEEVIGRASKLKQPAILKIVKEKSESNDLTKEFLESIERDLDKLAAELEAARALEDKSESLKAESKAVRRLSKRLDKLKKSLD